MDKGEKQRLLEACVEAQRHYEEALKLAREIQNQRKQAFLQASRSAITNTEIARETGLSNSQVGNIMRGTR